jgi:hypothetical protein
MIRKINNKMLMGLVLAAGIMNMPTLASAAQSESPVACDELTEPLPLVYGDHTTGCEISPVLDIDRFIFDGVTGDDVRIVIRTFDNRPDPRLEVRDPDGVVIWDDFCGTTTTNACTLVAELSLVKSGAYQLAVSDTTSTGAGVYTLQLEKIPPNFLPQGIVYNAPAITDEIDPVTDTDYFSFTGVVGTDIRLVISTAANRPDPHLVIWDPEGTVIHDSNCGTTTTNPCTISVDLNISIPGTYLVFISDQNYSGIGTYQVSLQCLFGPCPDVPPTRPECEIEMSQPVYIDGEEVIANVLSIANPTPNALALEVKIWLDLAGTTRPVLNLGADGSTVLPAGFNVDLGPVTLFTVDPGLPVGTHEFSCRMLDPVTGRLLREDRNFFEIQ